MRCVLIFTLYPIIFVAMLTLLLTFKEVGKKPINTVHHVACGHNFGRFALWSPNQTKTSLEHCTNVVDQHKYDVISAFHVILLCHQIQYFKNVNVTLSHGDSVMVILVMY